MNEAVRAHLPLVNYLEAILGRNSEIVLHDFTDLEHSAVEVRNGHVSGRTVGAPATDLALRIISDESYADRDFVAGYRSRAANGKELRSASLFIRDGDRRIVGMLCVNTDLTAFREAERALAGLEGLYAAGDRGADQDGPGERPLGPERLSSSSSDLIEEALSHLAARNGGGFAGLSQAGRVEVIRVLEKDGVFLLKGSVARVAERLGISEPSVYRYLQRVRKSG